MASSRTSAASVSRRAVLVSPAIPASACAAAVKTPVTSASLLARPASADNVFAIRSGRPYQPRYSGGRRRACPSVRVNASRSVISASGWTCPSGFVAKFPASVPSDAYARVRASRCTRHRRCGQIAINTPCAKPPSTARALDPRTDDTDGEISGAVTSNALAAAATSPALAPSAHCMPTAKHHSAITPTKMALYADVKEPSRTAAPISSDTAITRGIRPRGLSCSAVAPAIAAAPAAAVAAPVDPQRRAIAATTSTPSRLRATAPRSGDETRKDIRDRLPLITRPLSPASSGSRPVEPLADEVLPVG